MFPSTSVTKLIVDDSGPRCASVVDVRYPSQPAPLSLTALLSSGYFLLCRHRPVFESHLEQFLLLETMWASLQTFGQLKALRLLFVGA